MLGPHWRPRSALAITALSLATLATATNAQTPGEWRYTIVTDQRLIPADMKVNFPSVTFSACRTAEDFASGRAFALQTLASSAARCPSGGFTRSRASGTDSRGDSLSFVYACDGGKTLSGIASGRVQATRFSINLESRYSPPVGGVDVVKQTMAASRVGVCKVRPDANLMPVN